MPSSGPSKKDLYLGKSLTDLNRLSEVKPLNGSVNIIIRSSAKVYSDGEKCDKLGDEEKAFVMYMRYFNILKQVTIKAEYKKQKEYFDTLIGKKNQVTAIERAEKLSESLKERYDLKEAEAVAKKLGERNKQEEEKSIQNEKIKEKPSVSIEKQDAKLETPEVKSPSGSVTCTQLCTLLRDNGTKLILMDVRSATDFHQSHLSHTDCISVPEDILEPGRTVSHIESKLTDESKAVWQKRKHADHIIIIDWRSKIEDVKVGSPAKTLGDALFKYDTSVIIKSEPLVLDGGYEQWLIHYPMLTTNAHVSIPNGGSKNKRASPTFTYEAAELYQDVNFDFPDLDDDGKKIEPPTITESQSSGSVSSLNGVSSNLTASIPRVDRSLKPSLSKPATTFTNGSTRPNNAEANVEFSSQSSSNFQESTGGSNTELYPDLISGMKPIVVSGEKNTNIINSEMSKNIDLTVKNNLVSDLSESAHQRQLEEANLKQFQVSRDGRLREDKERINDLQTKLRELELIKKKEEKDVAALMRMKRKITEELDSENKKLVEDKQRLEEEEEQRLAALEKAKQDEEDKKQRLTEVEHLRAKRKLEEQNVARQKQEEEAQRQAEEDTLRRQKEDTLRRQKEDTLRRQKEELAESERKELEQLREEAAKRKQDDEEVAAAAQREKAEKEERKAQDEMRLKAQREVKERELEELRLKEEERKRQEERKREEEMKIKAQKEKELEEMKRKKQEEKATLMAQDSKVQLPAGWEKRLNQESNRYYYIDHNRGTTQWTPPTATADSPKKAGVSVTKLKEEPNISSSRGLSRSHSSPNIMKQLADEEKALRAQQIDRTIKPNVSSNKPIVKQTAYMMRKRDLNPVFGNVGGGLSGLRNLGNTCYMNSTVQCLSNTSPLVSYFLNDNFMDDINRESEKGMHGEVVDDFAVVIKALWSGQYRSITPRDLKSTIGKYSPMFAGYDQQDSQEFLTFLLDGLHEGLNEVKTAPNIPEQNNDHLTDEQAARMAWDHHKLLHRSVIVELFQGQLKSTLMCKTCRKTSITFQPFMYISLPIPKSSRCTLQNCIEEFLKPEMMVGSSRWKCTRCKVERDSEKKIDIWRLPRILLIGLNRFYSDGMWMQKKTTYVDFPVSELDMTTYTKGSPNPSHYSLYGISNHYGTMEGGHYTAFCRNSVTARWYKYDDQDVQEIHQSDIKSSAAFVLYYTSIPLKAPQYKPRL